MLFDEPEGYARIFHTYLHFRPTIEHHMCSAPKYYDETLPVVYGLYEANLQSYNERYNEQNEPVFSFDEFTQAVRKHTAQYANIYEFLKALHCISYQIEVEAAKCKTIPSRRGVEFLERLISGVESFLVREDTRYKDAHWAI
jgi:hypothetical protein